jgi:hypothetical protein
VCEVYLGLIVLIRKAITNALGMEVEVEFFFYMAKKHHCSISPLDFDKKYKPQTPNL